MRKILAGSLLISILTFHYSEAQRNLIEVPTSEIVEYKKLFLQAQAVYTKEEINTSLVSTYGLGYGFEVGFTLSQLHFRKHELAASDPSKSHEPPDFLVDAQKGFIIEDWLKLGLGTRSGMSATEKISDFEFVNFNYMNSQFLIKEGNHHFNAGIYYGNEAYVVQGNNFGLMAGIDVTLVKERLNFMSDFLSGNSSLSVVNAGFEISLPKKWKVILGAQFPLPASDNEKGAILQISKN
jgi:hypothetical protein